MLSLDKISKLLGIDPSKQLDPSDIMQGIGRGVDSVTSAPVRAAVGAMQKGEGLGGMAKAFASQVAEDPDTAPTPKQLLENDPLTAPYKDNILMNIGVGTMLDASNVMPALSALKAAKTIAKPVKAVAGALSKEGDVSALTHVMDVARNHGLEGLKDVDFRINKLGPGGKFAYRVQNNLLSPEELEKHQNELNSAMREVAKSEAAPTPEEIVKKMFPEFDDAAVQEYLNSSIPLPPIDEQHKTVRMLHPGKASEKTITLPRIENLMGGGKK